MKLLYHYQKLPQIGIMDMPAILLSLSSFSRCLLEIKTGLMLLNDKLDEERKKIINNYMEKYASVINDNINNDKNKTSEKEKENAYLKYYMANSNLIFPNIVHNIRRINEMYKEFYPTNDLHVDKLISFLSNFEYILFHDTSLVYAEQISEWYTRPSNECQRYYISISDDTTMIISMFAWKLEFEGKLIQKHMYIVKNIIYSFNNYMYNKQELKNSAMLLHSFTSYLLNTTEWYTFPLASMTNILKKSNIKYSEISTSEALAQEYIQREEKNNCADTNRSNILVIIPIDDKMKNLWLTGYQITKQDIDIENDKGTFIVEIESIQTGGLRDIYLYKYIKYKSKYINHKYKQS